MRQHVFRRSVLIGAATAAALALALSGCSGSASSTMNSSSGSTPVKGGNLVVAVPTDPQSLDPEVTPGQVTQYIGYMIFEGLFALDKNYDPQPMLAKDDKVSSDGLTYTIDLRSGVPFSDGHIFNADDAVASLRYWMKVSSTGQQVAGQLTSLTKTGDDQITIKLKQPRYSLIGDLASANAYMLEAKYADTLTPKGMSQAQIVGTGPYKLKSYTSGVSVVLDRFNGYKGVSGNLGGFAGAKHAYLDSITYQIVGDNQALINGLQAGTYQMGHPTDDSYDTLKANPAVKLATEFGGNANVIVPNWTPGTAFATPAARQALNLFMDKKAMNDAAGANPSLTEYDGALSAKSVKTMWNSAGESTYEAHDVAKAKADFAAAGITSATTINIVTSSTYPAYEAWAVELQSEFKKIGITAKIQSYDFVTMLGKLSQSPKDWDITMLYYPGQVSVPSQAYQLSGGFLGERDPVMDQLMTAYQSSKTKDEAFSNIKKLQAEMWKSLPVIPLSMSVPWVAMSPKLHGYASYPVYWNTWLSK